MTTEEQAAIAQMMMGLRTQVLGTLQQMDGMLRLLAQDAQSKPERKIPRLLGDQPETEYG